MVDEHHSSSIRSIRKMVKLNERGCIERMFWENKPEDDFKEEVMIRWGWTSDTVVPIVELKKRGFNIYGETQE